MKILFVNHILNASIVAATPNVNYPASNIQSQFLEKKFKSLGVSDIITITFPDNVDGNSFFYGFSNVNYMQVLFYNNASVLIGSKTLDCSHDSGSVHFPLLSGVRSIVINAQSPSNSDLVIGGLAFGTAITLPDPDATFIKDPKSLSTRSVSSFGQAAVRFARPLLSVAFQFSDVPKETFEEVYQAFEEVDIGHVWIDATEWNHDAWQPLYCTTETISRPRRDGRVCSFEINATEAR